MNCPLCNSPMTRAYRIMNHPPENHIVGYTDTLHCSREQNRACNCTIDIVVRDNAEMHDCISGENYRLAMGEVDGRS